LLGKFRVCWKCHRNPQEVARRLGLLENDGSPSEVFDLGAHRKLRGKK
jgi:hypothetical protein